MRSWSESDCLPCTEYCEESQHMKVVAYCISQLNQKFRSLVFVFLLSPSHCPFPCTSSSALYLTLLFALFFLVAPPPRRPHLSLFLSPHFHFPSLSAPPFFSPPVCVSERESVAHP
ncbi:unnamed protein product [Arctogadus glacialis]